MISKTIEDFFVQFDIIYKHTTVSATVAAYLLYLLMRDHSLIFFDQ